MTQDGFFLACGLASAALSTCAFLPYMRDMVLGAARPLRSTWLIWAVLSAISAATNWAEGASGSLAFVLVQAGFTGVIFLLSLRHGMGGFLSRGDLKVLSIAATGLVLWWITDTAAWALAISIAISAVGGAAMILKTYRAPQTEPYSCWLISCAAAFVGILSVGAFDPVLLAYPLYLFVLYSSILAAKALGAARLARLRDHQSVAPLRPVPLLLAPRQRVDFAAAMRKAS